MLLADYHIHGAYVVCKEKIFLALSHDNQREIPDTEYAQFEGLKRISFMYTKISNNCHSQR